jgi:hypothetical protein
MKAARLQDPTRWRDRDADAHALESRAAVLADAAAQVPPLGPQALSRIRRQVTAQRSKRGLSGFGRLSVRARLTFGIGLVLLCVTTADGASALWRRYVSSGGRAAAPPVEKTVRQIPHRVARVGERGPTTDAPAVSTTPAFRLAGDDDAKRALPRVSPTRPITPRPVAIVTHAPKPTEPLPPPAETPASAPQAKVTEAGLIAEALSDLRQGNDPRAALSTLDRYAQAFPHGVLETEAFRTRVEAVVQLGDLKTALALLEGQPAGADPLGPELLLTRAELRAAAGRFREALTDFNQVLDSAAGPLATGGDERALYGRAMCLGHLAQDERARVDLLDYQRRFPNGRFAVEVQRLLAGPAQSPRP